MTQHALRTGHLALMYRMISSQELAECVAAHRQTGGRVSLDRLMVALGYLDEEEMRLLRRADDPRFKDRPPADVGLARLLIQRDYCRPEDVAACRVYQSDGDRSFVRSLIELGVVTERQLVALLRDRKRKVCPTCERVYELVGERNGYRMRCPSCYAFLAHPATNELAGPAETLFFDRNLAESYRAVASVAVKGGFASIEEVRQAVEVQSTTSPHRSLPRILQELGYLAGAEERQELSRQVAARLESRRRERDTVLRESRIGAMAVKFRLASEDEVRHVLSVQADRRDRGGPRRIGEILVEEALVTRRQLRMLLEYQQGGGVSLN